MPGDLAGHAGDGLFEIAVVEIDAGVAFAFGKPILRVGAQIGEPSRIARIASSKISASSTWVWVSGSILVSSARAPTVDLASISSAQASSSVEQMKRIVSAAGPGFQRCRELAPLRCSLRPLHGALPYRVSQAATSVGMPAFGPSP